MARRPAEGTRQRILDTAARLFREHGVRAVGLQQVIDETGLGKSPLYREFASKDDLVAAWLAQGRDAWWASTAVLGERHRGDPVGQLRTILEVAWEAAREDGFQGCIFHNTSAEFRDADHPGHLVAVEHLWRIRAHLHDLGVQAAAKDPDLLADALMIIMDGLYVNAALLGLDGPARVALTMGEQLIADQCGAVMNVR